MASFPNSKVHRPSRRKLGRGQLPPLPIATAAGTASTVTISLTASVPGVWRDVSRLLSVADVSYVSQTQVSSTLLHVTVNSSAAGKAWSLKANAFTPNSGGGSAAASGTF